MPSVRQAVTFWSKNPTDKLFEVRFIFLKNKDLKKTSFAV